MEDGSDLEDVLSISDTLPTMAAQQNDQRVVFASYKKSRDEVVSHWND